MKLTELAADKAVVAVGECGFDFYYNDRSENRTKQTQLLEGQLQIATKYNLPLSFHVREAFNDFWPVFDNFKGLRGVLHSFSDSQKNVEQGLKRNLYFGVNGIATFTSHTWQRELYAALPLQNIVIETDAPFLTPVPLRGTINTPKNVINITEYMAELKGEDAKYIAQITTNNARKLFGI